MILDITATPSRTLAALWVDGEVVAIASFPPEDQDGLTDAFDWAQDTAARFNLTLTLE